MIFDSSCFNGKLKFMLSLFIFSPLFVFSQYYGNIKYPIKVKGGPLGLDSISYKITKIQDRREDRSLLGTGYYGVANHFVRYEVKNGVPNTFEKFFKKILRKSETGERKILVEFNELSVYEKSEDLGVKGGRRKHFKIDVSYFFIQEGRRLLVTKSEMTLDSISKNSRYFISEFCSDFFRKSLKELNNKLKTFDLSKSLDFVTEDSLNQIITLEKDTTGFKLKGSGEFIFNETQLNSEIKKAIKSKYLTSPKGRYSVEYTTHQNSFSFTTIHYKKSSVSPYIYITLPLIIILGLISGAS